MRTLLIGIGAQKAGTTLIYDALRHQAGVSSGPLKEMHIWDAIDNLEAGYSTFGIRKIRGPKSLVKYLLRRLLVWRPAIYFFVYKLIAKITTSWILLDFTPSYAGLSAESYKKIFESGIKNGFKIKFIYVLRDPVERHISAVRMRERKGLIDSFNSSEEFDIALVRALSLDSVRLRARYDSTITNLEAASLLNDVLILGYESIGSSDFHSKLQKFLQIPIDNSHFSKKSNYHGSPPHVSQGVRAQIFQEFKEVYDFCDSAIPEISASWWRPRDNGEDK